MQVGLIVKKKTRRLNVPTCEDMLGNRGQRQNFIYLRGKT